MYYNVDESQKLLNGKGRHQMSHSVRSHLHEIPRKGKPIEIEVDGWRQILGEGGNGEWLLNE